MDKKTNLNDEILSFIKKDLHFANETDAISFIEKKIEEEKHETIAFLISASIRNDLDYIRKELPQYGKRMIAETSKFNEKINVKQPISILEKIYRSNIGKEKGEITIENFLEKIDDIIRFRIICNFLSDLDTVEEKFIKKLVQRKGIKKISDKVDKIIIPTEERISGHRAHLYYFKYGFNDKYYPFEIQFMTLLQNAWDKKEHNLIYEYQRVNPKNDKLNLEKIKMFSMSELLYIADSYFDELKMNIEKKRRNLR